jgi:hypothetical protein
MALDHRIDLCRRQSMTFCRPMNIIVKIQLRRIGRLLERGQQIYNWDPVLVAPDLQDALWLFEIVLFQSCSHCRNQFALKMVIELLLSR